jgi:hypothetical protein
MAESVRRGATSAKDASIAQLAVARVAAQGEDVMPVVGARRLDPRGTVQSGGVAPALSLPRPRGRWVRSGLG